MGLQRISKFESWAPEGGPLIIGNNKGTDYLALFEREPRKNHTMVALELVDHVLSWSLYFYDPDGNSFEITTYEYRQVFGSRV